MSASETIKYGAALSVSKLSIRLNARAAARRAKKEFKAANVIEGIELLRKDARNELTSLSTVRMVVAEYVTEQTEQEMADALAKSIADLENAVANMPTNVTTLKKDQKKVQEEEGES